MRVTRPISNFFTRTTIGRQFGVVVAVGMLSLAICLSLVSSWLGGRRDSDNLNRQGARSRKTWRQKQARPAVGFAENAASAMSVTLNFPDIVRIEISPRRRGRALTSLDKTGASARRTTISCVFTPELLQGGVVMEGKYHRERLAVSSRRS